MTPVQAQSKGNATVEAGIDRLLTAVEAGLPLSLAARSKADGTHLARSAGGHVRSLVAPPGRTWVVSRPGSDTSPEGLALSFLRENRAAFGWTRRGVSLGAAVTRRSTNRSYVRLEQRFAGLPVFGAAALVQVEESGGVSFVLSDIARDDARMHEPDFPTEPSVADGSAVSTALGVAVSPSGSSLAADAPVLMVYEPSVIGSAGPSRLVWHVRVRSSWGDVNEVVLVDASTGEVAFHYSDIKHAKSRSIYDSANVPGSPGTLVRSEGGPASGIVDANLAYQYFGDTYDFYFTRFGRDSYDGAGATLVGRVRYCDATGTCPLPNAYWNGSEMRFGAGYAAADDVVAHELTHAVTERESNLIYWGESGAINEALSDIFGEFVDLSNSGGTDGPSVRWLVGEDLPGGAIRSMADPTVYGDPDRRFSPVWYTGAEDNRGVHFNSGVANKLAYLVTDGASFNGQVVTGQGTTAVDHLFYEAQVNLLVPASDYFDLYAALRQAAKNKGWGSSSRDALEAASRAVEINLPGNAVTVFTDGFEGSFPGSWQILDQGGTGSGVGTQWGRSTYRKASGTASAYCAAGGSSPSTGTPPVYKPEMDTWMDLRAVLAVVHHPGVGRVRCLPRRRVPVRRDLLGRFHRRCQLRRLRGFPGARRLLRWRNRVFRGGRTSSSTSRRSWTRDTRETPLGQPQVWLAFQFVSDNLSEYEGAYIDNVVIQKAPSAAPFGSFDYPANGTSGLSGSVALQGWALDDYQVTKVDIYRNPVAGETPGPNGKIYVGDAVQVPGLRPDIEAGSPGYPYAYKAGWSRNLPSYFLPSNGNGTFTFYAYAYDADGRSTLLGTRILSFTNTVAGLAAPTISSPTAGQVVSVSGVGFAWSAVGGADRYDMRIWRRPAGEVVYTGSVLGAASTSNLVSLPDGQYQFSVRACSGGVADAQCGLFSSVLFTVNPAGPSGAPTVTFPTQGATLTTSTHTLQWTAVTPNPALSGLTYEVLLRDIEAGTTALQISVLSPSTSTIFTMGSSSHYELKVRACQAGCGPWSTPVSFSVSLPAVPTGSAGDRRVRGERREQPDVQLGRGVGGGPVPGAGGAAAAGGSWGRGVDGGGEAGVGDDGDAAGAGGVRRRCWCRRATGTGAGRRGRTGSRRRGRTRRSRTSGRRWRGRWWTGRWLVFTWNRVPGDTGTNTLVPAVRAGPVAAVGGAGRVHAGQLLRGVLQGGGCAVRRDRVFEPRAAEPGGGSGAGIQRAGSERDGADAGVAWAQQHGGIGEHPAGVVSGAWGDAVPVLRGGAGAASADGDGGDAGAGGAGAADGESRGDGVQRDRAGVSCGCDVRSRGRTRGGARGPTPPGDPESPTSPSLRRQLTRQVPGVHAPGRFQRSLPAQDWLRRVLICSRRETSANPSRPRWRPSPARGARRPADPAEASRARGGPARVAGDPVGPSSPAGVRAAGASSSASPAPAVHGRLALLARLGWTRSLRRLRPRAGPHPALRSEPRGRRECLPRATARRPARREALHPPGRRAGDGRPLGSLLSPRTRRGPGRARPGLRRGRERRERALSKRPAPRRRGLRAPRRRPRPARGLAVRLAASRRGLRRRLLARVSALPLHRGRARHGPRSRDRGEQPPVSPLAPCARSAGARLGLGCGRPHRRAPRQHPALRRVPAAPRPPQRCRGRPRRAGGGARWPCAAARRSRSGPRPRPSRSR